MKPFEDYKREVWLAYQKKKDERSLHPDLENHTPASLKRECLNEFPARYSDKYRDTFRSLFGAAETAEEYYQKITAADPDIFKPLNNFLKGKTDTTHSRNIYLLAWLIDFEPISDTAAPLPPIDPYSDLIARVINWFFKKFKNIRVVYRVTIAILAVVILLYIITRPRYMYWNGNEYQPLAFYQDTEGLIIIRIDTLRLRHLKKITNLKSITRNSIGKVHYSSIKNKYQFYSMGGENPEDTARRLLPMSELIFNKYVLKKTH